MKIKFRRTLILVMAFLVCLISPLKIFAATNPTNPTSHFNVVVSLSGNEESKTVTYYSPSGDYSTKRSKNTKKATVTYNSSDPLYGGASWYRIKFKKYGTVTIIDDRYGSKAIYTTIKYQPPVETLVLGKVNLTKDVKNSFAFSGEPITGKIKFKVKSGWKLTESYKIALQGYGSGVQKHITINPKKKISIKKGERLILVFKKGDLEGSIRYTAK